MRNATDAPDAHATIIHTPWLVAATLTSRSSRTDLQHSIIESPQSSS